MSEVNHIRDMARNGYRISEISKETGKDPKTIRKYLMMDDFSETPKAKAVRHSILDPYVSTIREWQEEDKKTWKKQRHTAKRIFERLVAEKGYTGSYDTVQKYIKNHRVDKQNKASQELIWEPGFAQVDFGEADFDEDTDRIRMKYLVVSFPYSNDGYAQVFGGETSECVCQGLQDIFCYIGGVPKMLVFDNATGVGHRVHDEVTETELFQRFRAHYGFQIRFCNPHAGYEKGNVENKVGTVRRNLFVPVRRYHDLEKFNGELLTEHRKKAAELHYKKQEVIAKLFEEDKKSFLPLPAKKFNVCSYESFKADGYGKVCIDGKHYYSTKPENHGQKVLVGKRAHYIDILNPDGTLLVRHKRKYGDRRTDESDYSTSLNVLARNAGAWDNSGVRKELPDPLREYLDGLERKERKEKLKLLNRLNDSYGFSAAVEAMNLALNHGNVNKSDAVIIAERITGYGISTPPEAGPSLDVYDKAFLPQESGDEAV